LTSARASPALSADLAAMEFKQIMAALAFLGAGSASACDKSDAAAKAGEDAKAASGDKADAATGADEAGKEVVKEVEEVEKTSDAPAAGSDEAAKKAEAGCAPGGCAPGQCGGHGDDQKAAGADAASGDAAKAEDDGDQS